MRITRRHFLLTAPALAAGAGPPAEPAWYLVLFGAERDPFRPVSTHTFATFVAAELPARAVLDVRTISWLPASLIISRAGKVQPGHNFTFAETLDWSVASGMTSAAWGPFRVRPELYELAAGAAARLDSGRVRYTALDYRPKWRHTSNCVHAIDDMVRPHRGYVGPFGFGEAATRRTLDKLLPYVVGPCETHPWVADALGLGRWPLAYRDLSDRPTRCDAVRSFAGHGRR